jgi:hypothetical protein
MMCGPGERDGSRCRSASRWMRSARSSSARSADPESLPSLIAVSAMTLLLSFVPEVVLFVPDLIFGKDRR